MRSAVVLALLVLVVPATALTPGGPVSDPQGDQDATGVLYILSEQGSECSDPSMDVVHADVWLTSDALHATIQVADANTGASCFHPSYGRHEFADVDRTGVLNVYFEGYWESGYYLAWTHDDAGQGCAYLTYGYPYWSTECLAGSGSLSGNSISWSFPRNGQVATEHGETKEYRFPDSFRYYGRTQSEAWANRAPLAVPFGALEDQYGWVAS